MSKRNGRHSIPLSASHIATKFPTRVLCAWGTATTSPDLADLLAVQPARRGTGVRMSSS
jgi:hypothetical protein